MPFQSKALSWDWIPTEEKLPDSCGTYLVFGSIMDADTECGVSFADFHADCGEFFQVEGADPQLAEITHWMPLPAPPSAPEPAPPAPG